MNRSCILIILTLIIYSCSPKTFSGVYSSHANDAVLMAGYTYDFHEDKTFTMKYWSDDISSNVTGHGSYSVDKGYLLLTFYYMEPIISSYTTRTLTDNEGIMSALKFAIKDNLEAYLGGVNIIIWDTGGEMVANGITDMSGSTTVLVPKTDIPKTIDIRYIGMKGLTIPLPDASSKSYDIILASKTEYVSGGEEQSYKYKVRGEYLKLRGGKNIEVLRKVH